MYYDVINKPNIKRNNVFFIEVKVREGGRGGEGGIMSIG